MPALLTARCSAPNFSTANSTAALLSLRVEASILKAKASPLESPISPATRSAAARLMSAAMIFAPCAARSLAVASPSPEPAPVTRATFPLNVVMFSPGAVAKLGGEQRRLSFSFPDGRCVWAFSGRLEDPVDDHRVRVRLPVRSNIVPCPFRNECIASIPFSDRSRRRPVLKCTFRPQDPLQPTMVAFQDVVEVFHLPVFHCWRADSL